MKITDIQIDGFGVWRDLPLRGLSPEITVVYGPNEAGKTTLMQFLRSVLYGVSPPRRQRYLPPLEGGRPGGWLKVIGDDGPLTIARYADRGPEDVGKVTVTAADGSEHGARLLREALDQIDEPTFNNIFAVGLREVQELGTLSDTAAAQWLYRLTSGLDRVSLYDVIHLLARTRLRLLNGPHEESELRALVGRRDQLRGELDVLVAKGRRWAQSAMKLRELADEVDRRQAAARSLEAAARRLEVAINLKPLWIKRAKIDAQLDGYAGLPALEDGTLQRLDELNHRIDEHQRQCDILRGKRQQLRDEARQLGINDALVRNRLRLEALVEQQEWLQAVEQLAGQLADEAAQLEARLASENERLSHEWTGAGKLPPRITSDVVEQLAPQARAVEASEQLVDSARHELELQRTGEHQYRTQIESAMASGDRLGLPKDLDAAGELVARLRRRQQVEQRLEAARRQADDLQQQGEQLVDAQVVPMSLFSPLMAVFVLGFVSLGAWWLMPESWLGQYGLWAAALGIGGSLFALLFKYFAENSAADRFDACHRQLQLVLEQIEAAETDLERLDRELPMAEGSAALRLQHAEKHLAELERVLPVESQRREAAEEISAAERRAKLAEEKHTAALANWKARLRALGLPDILRPADLETMAGQCARIAELEARIETRREEAARRRREFDSVSKRIAALAEETGLRLAAAGGPPDEESDETGRLSLRPLEQLDHLVHEYHQEKQRAERRGQLRKHAKTLRAEQAKHFQTMRSHQRRREALFEKCGVEDEQALRQLVARISEAGSLRKKRAAVTREIAAAIGKQGTEPEFAPLLAPEAIGRLESDWESFSSQREALDCELKELLQRRGAMVEQQRAAAADHSLAAKQIELDVVEEQFERAVAAWRERAALSLLLERIREDYEKHRQPETLQEASGYLARLTSGAYTRIWTPLASDILLVDTAAGQSLPVEVLSRGTREQLFVSLRLALVAAFARRGVHLPMILDDVLVNFDAGRARIAATVLRDFAGAGHQLLVFTCHEHVWQMFRELKVDTRRLPSRLGDDIDEAAAPAAAPLPVLEEALPPLKTLDEADTELDEPDAPSVEEIDLDAVPPASHAPPTETEVEYWWSEPVQSNGQPRSEPVNRPHNEWLPEPVIYPDRW